MVDRVIQECGTQSYVFWETEQYSVTRPKSPGLAKRAFIDLGDCRPEILCACIEECHELGGGVGVRKRRSRCGVESVSRDHQGGEPGEKCDVGGELTDRSGFRVRAPAALAVGESLKNATG